MAKQTKPELIKEAIPAEVLARIPEDGVTLSAAVRAGTEVGVGPENQIMVVGPKRGRWRAGRLFTSEPTIIDIADLPEENVQALISDPMLIVGPAFPQRDT
jgi:hypothetical protein